MDHPYRATTRANADRYEALMPQVRGLLVDLSGFAQKRPADPVSPMTLIAANRLLVSARRVLARDPGRAFVRPIALGRPVSYADLVLMLSQARIALLAFEDQNAHGDPGEPHPSWQTSDDD